MDGVDAPFRRDSRVSAATGDDKFGFADAFALGFEPSFGTEGRLKNKNGLAFAGFPFDDLARCGAADFLIGSPEEDNFMARRNFQSAESVRGSKGDDMPALHVERAGAPGAAAGDAKRHFSERPDGINGVEMSQDEKLAARGVAHWRKSEFGANVIAAIAIAENAHAGAAALPFGGGDASQAVNGWFVVTRRFDFDESLQQEKIELFAAANPGEQITHRRHGGAYGSNREGIRQ